jgi:ELWxxDGT repeat protein
MKKITLFLLFISINIYSQYNYFGTDMVPNAESSQPRDLTSFNNKIYFSATFKKTDANGGFYYDQEMGYFNPTDNSYGQFANINAIELTSAGSAPRNFFEFNGHLYFTASSGNNLENRELYRTNGVTVELFKDLIPGTGSGFPQGSSPQFTIMNNKLYFFARNDAQTGDAVLWQTDGTAQNTVVVSTIAYQNSTGLYKNCVIAFNNELFFCGSENLGSEVYKFNDVTNTTTLLKDLFPGTNSGVPSEFTIFNDELFFVSFTPTYTGKRKICKTDGTTAGTTDVLDAILFSHTPTGLTVLNNKLVFVAVNPATTKVNLFKCEFNSTLSNYAISLVKEFVEGQNLPALILDNKTFTLFNNELYFVASQNTDPNNGGIRQIYKTNASTAGTVKAIAIDANQVGSNQIIVTINNLFTFNNKLCFGMRDLGTAQQLWISNGSNSYIEKLTNVGNGLPQEPFLPDHETIINKLYVTAGSSSPFRGEELWQIEDASPLSNEITNTYSTFLLYPNPTQGVINVQLQNSVEFTVEIFDLIGKKVGQFSNQNQLDISNYKSGIYLIKITDLQSNITTTQKVIKQ